MPTTTPVLKRSMKRLAAAAEENGWTVEVEEVGGDILRLAFTTDPALPDDVPAPETLDHPTRRRLSVARLVVSGSAETGAWYGAAGHDADGGSPGLLGLDTVSEVESLLRFRAHYIASARAAAERTVTARLVAAERKAVRDAYLTSIADTGAYRSVVALAEREVPPLEIDVADGKSLYWASGAMTSHLTAVLRKRMAKAALDAVGWPVLPSGFAGERPGNVGKPITLVEALAKGVGEVLGRESSTSADYEALANAAKDVLRLA